MTTTGPLDGVLIADFGRVLAAPYATMLLTFGLAARLFLDPIVPLGGGVTVANPIKLPRTPPRYARRPPTEHNLEDR